MRYRLFRVILAALCRRRNLSFQDDSVLGFTAMPWDCVVKYVGNDRYPAFLDLGRIDLLIRLGGWQALIHEKLQPFVFTADIQYRHRLRLFQKFSLRTRLVHTDRNFFWMEHIFQCGHLIMATAISKIGMTFCSRLVSTQTVLRLLYSENTRPPYPQNSISIVNGVEKLLRSMRGD